MPSLVPSSVFGQNAPSNRIHMGLIGLGLMTKYTIAFLVIGESRIELLEPTAADSPVAKFLEKNGEGVHHLCFQVEDAAAALAHAKGKGARLIDETPRVGVHGMRIGFLHPKSTFGVLTEFAQEGEGEN